MKETASGADMYGGGWRAREEEIDAEENLKSRPSVKRKVLGVFNAKEEGEKAQLRPQQYESGLEVAHPLPWNPNDVPPPEVSPCSHLDANTMSTPQVAHDPSYHRPEKSPGLEVATTSSQSAMSPGGQSSTLYEGSQDGSAQHPAGHHRSTDAKSVDGFGMGPRVCGMRWKVFYIVMAVVIIFAVAAIAIGVGAGLALRRRPSGDRSSGSGSIPAAVESTKTANISCPTYDNATFSAQAEPDRLFRLICGHDYNSDDGATDLAAENATSMANCIDRCASRTQCVGAGWGDYYGNRVCWMKSRLGTPNVSGNWVFAVDLNGTDPSTLP